MAIFSGSPGKPGNRDGSQEAPPWFARVQKLGRHTAQAGLLIMGLAMTRGAAPPSGGEKMMSTELSGAIVRLRTKDEYDGMLGKICGAADEGDMVAVKHRPITYPHRRDTILHYFKMNELEILRS